MDVNQLARVIRGRIIVEGKPTQLTKGYCGDLLSYVMGRAVEGGVWFTIINNVNVSAVAKLADVGAVVICDCVMPDSNLIDRMSSQRIPLLCTPLSVYDSAVLFHDNNV